MPDATIWHDEGLDILDEDECLRLLATVPIGRVGICSGALPAILPVNFELYGRSIVFRTGRGTKLDAAVRSAVVAFQADQYDAPVSHRVERPSDRPSHRHHREPRPHRRRRASATMGRRRTTPLRDHRSGVPVRTTNQQRPVTPTTQ